MTAPSHRRRPPLERGQALVIMAVALAFLILPVTALVLDGGNAFAQQRVTQAGTDAAANAGAIVLSRLSAGATTPAGGWDSAVETAVTSAAAANGVDVPIATGGGRTAWYTDICGVLLRPNGQKANSTAEAAPVGGGSLPVINGTDVDCPSGIVGPVAGVQVAGAREFDTLIARAIGFSTFTAGASATAVTGLLQGTTSGTVLPVTSPVFMVTCDGSGDVVPVVEGSIEPNWPKNKTVTIPLCKNNPGNVGWLDWSPKAGGTSELIDAILTPSNPAIDLPSWQYITETGNPNSKGVEDAINTYIGQVVLFPMFDLTCKDDPNFSLVNSPSDPNKGCPAGSLGGNGPNQWYRIPQFAALRLERAYVNGNNKSSCEENGNGAISCLVGQFVDFVTEGTVGPGFGGGNTLTGVLGVQLIK